jgi:hypothetical protein
VTVPFPRIQTLNFSFLLQSPAPSPFVKDMCDAGQVLA